MTMERGTQSGGRSNFVDDLNAAVSKNPVAAGLIGMGVLWMLLGGNRISALGGQVPNVAKSAASAIGAAAGAGAQAIGGGASAAADLVSSATGQVRDTLVSSAESAGAAVRDTLSAGYDALTGSADAVSDAAHQSARTAQRSIKGVVESSTEAGAGYAASFKDSLGEALERQPLLLGAIGLALGAGVAAAFPSTQTERNLMGASGDAVREKVKELTEDAAAFAKSHVSDVVEAVTQEAKAQGLTPADAKDQLKATAEKVKTVARTSWNH